MEDKRTVSLKRGELADLFHYASECLEFKNTPLPDVGDEYKPEELSKLIEGDPEELTQVEYATLRTLYQLGKVYQSHYSDEQSTVRSLIYSEDQAENQGRYEELKFHLDHEVSPLLQSVKATLDFQPK